MGSGKSSLTAAELRRIHGLRGCAGGPVTKWVEIDALFGRTVRHAYGRAERGSALTDALAEGAGADDTAVDLPPTTGVAPVLASPAVEQRTGSDGGVTLIVKDLPRVRTVEEVLAAGGLDPAHWTVKGADLKAYEGFMKSADGNPVVVPLTSATVKLEPNEGARAAMEAIRALLEDMKVHAPTYPQVRFTKPAAADRHMAVISMADNHIGMLSWADETGESYDVSIAEQLAAGAMVKIVERLQPYPIEKIILTIHGDWFHSDRTFDGKGGTTTRGTMQETDGRWQRTWRVGVRTAVGLIDQASAVAPVKVVMRPGNHDEQTAFFLGDLLAAWYRHNPAVEIVNIPAPRCYEVYGQSLIGFAHGHNEKPGSLPMLMATEQAKAWAATTFHDWLIAHKHRKGVLVDEESGVQTHTMPSLCGRDSWHGAKGYGHRRSCEVRIYHIDEGPIAELTIPASVASAKSAARPRRRKAA